MPKNKSIRGILDDFMNSDAYRNQERLLKERRKTIKTGKAVLHLEYIGEFTETDLNEINDNLKKVNLQLSSFNKSGVFYNALDEFSLDSFFVLSQPLISEIIKIIGTSALWDSIKWSLLYGWRKLKGKKYFKSSTGTIEEKEIKFGLNVKLDKNTEFNFKLEGDIDESTIETSLDKILDFLKEQKPNKSYKTPDYAYFSKEKDMWIKVDVMEEITKRIKKNEKKKK
ncbi:MAG: hypothetical protein IH597_00245 [Bacteroidales bacterium]|nr:hypothetical protein [Bacteroidales bacterium]